MKKTKKSILEKIRNELLERMLRAEIDVRLYKKLDSKNIVRVEQKATKMGVVSQNITVQDEINKYEKGIKEIQKTIAIVDKMLKKLDK